MTTPREVMARAIAEREWGLSVDDLGSHMKGRAWHAAGQIRDALREAGWIVVPAEPTEEMISRVPLVVLNNGRTHNENVRSIYRAMTTTGNGDG